MCFKWLFNLNVFSNPCSILGDPDQYGKYCRLGQRKTLLILDVENEFHLPMTRNQKVSR
jgi:hypothetical protein